MTSFQLGFLQWADDRSGLDCCHGDQQKRIVSVGRLMVENDALLGNLLVGFNWTPCSFISWHTLSHAVFFLKNNKVFFYLVGECIRSEVSNGRSFLNRFCVCPSSVQARFSSHDLCRQGVFFRTPRTVYAQKRDLISLTGRRKRNS